MPRLLLLACLVVLSAETASAGLSFGGETLRDKWREMNTPGSGGGGGSALPCSAASGDGEIHFTDLAATNNCNGDPDFTWAQTTNILTIDASGQTSSGITFAEDGSGPDYYIRAADKTIAGFGSHISILTGAAVSGNNQGGDFSITTGAGSGTSEGGDISITTGIGGTGSGSGDIAITAAAGGTSGAAGGTMTLTTGAGLATNGSGGAFSLTTGAGDGTG